MGQEKTDRRARRTRRLLGAALIALLQEKRYDRITVQDLIDRADVGRSTFYAHYRDKEDLLISEFARVLDELGRHLGGGAGDERLVPSLELFRHVRDHHDLYRALLRGGGAELLFARGHAHLREAIAGRLAALPAAGRTPAVPSAIVADYLAGALLTLLRWWLDRGMPHPPEEMEAIFLRLALPGVQAALGPAG